MRPPRTNRAAIQVRRGRTGDRGAAALVFSSASGEYTRLAGSPWRARATLRRLWTRTGHSASYEHSWVAEVDGKLVGVAIGFPTAARYRLHAALLRMARRDLPGRRQLLLAPALGWMVAAAPRPPRGSFYVSTVAVDPAYFRHGVGISLLSAIEAHARNEGSSQLAGHTGTRHPPMRSLLERCGFRPHRARRWGYVLYVLDLTR